MNSFSSYIAGSFFGFLITFAIGQLDVKAVKEQAYKQGQIDCIEGKIYYQPDTTTNYVKIEP